MQKRKTSYLKRSERASGDLLWYFVFHNIISVIFFFISTFSLGIYTGRNPTLAFIFSFEFLELVLFRVFPLYILCGIIGRITAFYIMRAYQRSYQKRATKRWSELNKGMNRMGLRFLITALFTSFLYSVGIITVLQYAIFNENTLLTLIIVYSSIKIGTFFFVRWLVGAKL